MPIFIMFHLLRMPCNKAPVLKFFYNKKGPIIVIEDDDDRQMLADVLKNLPTSMR